jgi:pyruvate,water dikinase
VAREYGIPAVMATVEGTRRLADGQRVRVDGARGLVFAAAAPTAEHDRPAAPAGR